MTTRRTKGKSKKATENISKTRSTLWKVFFLFCSVLLFLSLVSHHSTDLAILSGGYESSIQNWIGLIGAFASKILFFLFGISAYFLSFLFLFFSIQAFRANPYFKRKGFWFSYAAIIFGLSLLFAMWPQNFIPVTDYLGIGNKTSPYFALSGGVIGQFLAAPAAYGTSAGLIRKYIGTVGTAVLGIAFFASGSIFFWKTNIFQFIKLLISILKQTTITKKIKEEPKSRKDKTQLNLLEAKKRIEERRKKQKEELDDFSLEAEPEPEPQDEPLIKRKAMNTSTAIDIPPQMLTPATKPARKKTVQIKSNYKLPPVTLLKDLTESKGDSADIINEAKETLQDTLNSFGIEAKVTDAVTGPRVTRLEIVPSPGVRVQKISQLESNIKLDLKAESIRILAPIPGKDAVGIEIPNVSSSMVPLKGIFNSTQWKRGSSEIPIILGKNVAGESVITDLGRAPHLLIAGATGSGKSVCVNTLIMSLLYRFSPDELRLIMVDPKVVEFEMYQKLPHLITPVINEPKKVPLALRWAITEMEKRYRLLAKARVKNLDSFNSRERTGQEILDDDGNPLPEKMSFIIIIIDELADIMMVAKADVETSIARIAQKARAVGIHLVLATQRPSVQIITGIIKANLPTRIAFRVTSITDSRVILDHKGAESLLGRGDMLFIPPGSAKLDRIQGAILSDQEVESVVDFCAEQRSQDFDISVTTSNQEEEPESADIESTGSFSSKGESEDYGMDEDLIQQSIDIIRRERKASTSYLQRRLKIGYNRAAEIIDILESRGVIGPQMGSSRREIFIDPDDNSL